MPAEWAAGERYRLTATLLEKATELITTTDHDTLLEGLCRSLVEATPHILLAWVWIGPVDSPEIVPQIAVGPAREYAQTLKIRRNLLTQRGPVFQALSGADLVEMGISKRSLYSPWRRAARRYGFQAAIALRLSCPDGGSVGVIVLYGDSEDYFRKIGKTPFLAFARSAQSMLYQCSLVDRLRVEAITDVLTGLPNRRVFRSELERHCALTLQRNRLLAVGMLDLDNLKEINDRLGHAAGDTVLQQTAQRVLSVLRTGDVCARLGGDEFGLIVSDLACVEDLETLSDRILDALREPIAINEDLCAENSASLGWTLYPLENEDPNTLIRHADHALYAAKHGGKDQFALYKASPEMAPAEDVRPVRLLTQALQHGSLRLYYQPIVHRHPQGPMLLVGVEALLRANSGDLVLTPAHFGSALNHPRLARPVGRFVLQEALLQVEAWQTQGFDIPVSVNISVTHLLDPRFLEDIENLVLGKHSVSPRKITLEVTETAEISDLRLVCSILQQCRQWGLHVSLDDFGTGYSSLTYMQRFPATSIKIDSSFTRNIMTESKDLAIVRGIIVAAHSMGVGVIAEGVECAECADLLQTIQCNTLQGYWRAKPMTADGLLDWVRDSGIAVNGL
ncbi:MAG: putative bifunctional diguanylate cyclase/phosphodiesterase [Acidithiobacillus sp.]